MDAEIKKEFDRLNAKLTALLQESKKETWVKACVIMDLTGWDKEGMRKARINGLVKYDDKKGFNYLLESVHPMFIKKQTA